MIGEPGQSIFRWDTLRELGSETLPYRVAVLGTRCEIELWSGERIHVWRSDDRTKFFCHGSTFGGDLAPGGPISPFGGTPVEAILRGHYDLIPNEGDAEVGDILVWRGRPGTPEGTTPHSATLTAAAWTPGRNQLDGQATLLRTKNGLFPEAIMPLDELFVLYGETYDVYRRRPLVPGAEVSP
jgi:hypothetical protein